MMRAVRVVSVERGEDPRDCALLAFGGAGPLHAAEVAAELGMRQVIVPPHPGLLSARGLLDADVRGDFAQTCLVPAGPAGVELLSAARSSLLARADEWCEAEQLTADAVRREWRVDQRYAGQSFEIAIEIPDAACGMVEIDAAVAAFHEQHAALNGYAMADHPVEIVNLRLAIIAARPPTPLEPASRSADSDAKALRRPVWFRATGFVDTPLYQRGDLAPGDRIEGPAIVEQMDSTTVIPPEWRAIVAEEGSIRMELQA